MFSIYDGRTQFYQWDKNQKLIVNDGSIIQVHFANCLCANARVCETYTDGAITLVDVPNELITQDYDIKVWGYDGNATKHCAVFEVAKRTKPADYIHTDEELKTWEELESRVEELENNQPADIDLDNYVKKTDYATKDSAGLVRVYSPDAGTFGVTLIQDAIRYPGGLKIQMADDVAIKQKTNTYKPIVPANLDYAVKQALINNKQTPLADDEMWRMCEWLNLSDYMAAIENLREKFYSLEQRVSKLEGIEE